MKKIKLSPKTALVSGLVAASTAGIVYATPEILESRNSDTTDNLKLVVEKVDNDTARVSIDNIKEIPRSLQFSIKLDGVELKDGENSIHDLVLKEIETVVNNNEYQSNPNEILTDYTYNKDKNTIDVLITADNSIPKNANKIDVFEIDLKSKSKGIFDLDLIEMAESMISKNKVASKYTITPNDNVKFKYLSDANKEYVSNKVDYSKEEISMNSNPIISSDGRTIKLMGGENIQLTAENLGITMNDHDENDAVSLEVKYEGNVITEFSQTTPGVYNLEVVAKDSYGETSEELIIQVGVIEEKITTEPIITKGDKELEDVTLNAGDIFNPMENVKARDGKGNDLKVNLSVNKELDLDPETTTEYKLMYSAIDKYENKAEKTIAVTVNANKAPVILGVKDHNLMVGDSFDPSEGVTVIDEDENIELQIDSNVNINIQGEYKVSYTATDSKGRIARAQSKVVVISNEIGINNPPEIYVTDKIIKLGTVFNPLDGVTATDREDGTITNKIKVIENTVNINEEGQYKVTYRVEDNNGVITTKTITVTVKGELNLVESITINNKFSKMYLENEKTVTASINGDADVKDVSWSTSNSNVAEIEVIGNSAKIIARSEGKATITVSTKDGSNKTDSFTINVVSLQNDSEMPSYIKDIVDTNILLPIAGNAYGTENSPVEFEMRNITVDELDVFLKSLNKLNPIIKNIYSKGDFTVYNLKLTQEVGLLDKLRNIKDIGLFNSNVDIYIEIKVNNYLSNASQLKARLNELKSDNNSGSNGGNNGSSSGGNGNTGGNDGSLSGGNGNTGGNDGSLSGGNGNAGGNDGSLSGVNGSTGGNDGSLSGVNGSTGGNNESLSDGNGSGINNGTESFNNSIEAINNTGAVESTKTTENSKEFDDEEVVDNSESKTSETADDSKTSKDKGTSERLEVSENLEKVDEKNTIVTVLGYGVVIVAAIISSIFFLKNKK